MERFPKRLAEISLAGNIIMNLSCVYLNSSRTFQLTVAHGLTVRPPNRDKLTMRAKSLKARDLILSLSKDEASDFMLFQQPARLEVAQIFFAISRRTYFCTLPVEVFGSSSKTTWRGTL